jgi:hypothetical protein
MLEAAQEAEGSGCEAAGRGGRLLLLLPPSASIIPAEKSRPTALLLPMVSLWLSDSAQNVPWCRGHKGGEMHTIRREHKRSKKQELLGPFFKKFALLSEKTAAAAVAKMSHKDTNQSPTSM